MDRYSTSPSAVGMCHCIYCKPCKSSAVLTLTHTQTHARTHTHTHTHRLGLHAMRTTYDTREHHGICKNVFKYCDDDMN